MRERGREERGEKKRQREIEIDFILRFDERQQQILMGMKNPNSVMLFTSCIGKKLNHKFKCWYYLQLGVFWKYLTLDVTKEGDEAPLRDWASGLMRRET